MKRTHGVSALALLTLSVGFWSVASRAQQEPQQEGVAAKAGEKLDEVGRAIKKGIVDAEETVRDGLNKTGESVRGGLTKTGESVREGFSKTRESVQGMGLIPRVYGRLHWDKALHSSTLFVKAEGGTVIIRGLVPDDAAKAKAVALVKDTVGVTQVIVQISVASSSIGTTSSPNR
jgi:hyperosmotically inducible periplasmic protein